MIRLFVVAEMTLVRLHFGQKTVQSQLGPSTEGASQDRLLSDCGGGDFICAPFVNAQSTASTEGQVIDHSGSVIPAVEIKAISRAIAVERTTNTHDLGRYQISALPVGEYRIEVRAADSAPRSWSRCK
jgi:hypothetical protein